MKRKEKTNLSKNPASTPQPKPTGEGDVVLDRVLEDLRSRAEFGYRKYGTLLRTHNGRKPLIDLYQELLDACMYVAQEIMEREDAEKKRKRCGLGRQG